MAISSKHDKKSPSQKPTHFYKLEQQGGAYGKGQAVPDVLVGGTMMEKVYGRPNLSKPMTGNSGNIKFGKGGK